MLVTQPLRLSEFRVRGLFGEYDHNISLNQSERITAIIAPNGYGKTVCLRLIDALFGRKWSLFNSVDYFGLEYIFSDNSSVEVSREASSLDEEFSAPPSSAQFIIRRPESLLEEFWQPKISEKAKINLAQIERYLPFVTRIAPTRWAHDHTNQVFGLQELLETFPEHLPNRMLTEAFGGEPEALKQIISGVDCHLIETQRLLIIGNQDQRIRHSTPIEAKYAIQDKAQKLKAIITTQLTEYASLSQSLDRSFPRRVISNFGISPSDNIKSGLSDLDNKRRRLMSVGILDSEGDESVALPAGPIDAPVARLLSVYVDDTARKLATLDTILGRVQLFKELIESRFLNKKKVNISRTNGFSISYNQNEVPLEKLSSGEQHQLVLFFELLFELEDNALILIDEPELSLHVSWQRRFISDLHRIIELNNFEVVLATHSPQLIGSWQHLMVELGDVEAE